MAKYRSPQHLLPGLKSKARQLGHQLEEWAYRGLDQHLRVGVTGLSGAGKTAFITALVHQLLHAERDHLPMWQVLSEGRWLGARRERQPDLTLAPFDFDGAMTCLGSHPPIWPPSTRGISEIRLALRYRPGSGLRRQVSDQATLYLDLVDYPGEWLLDLPLLDLDYRQWSQAMWQRLNAEPWQGHSEAWRQSLEGLDDQSDARIGAVADAYAELLRTLQGEGATVLQPGRALLPAELAGTPVIAFFPLPDERDDEDPLFQLLAQRYQAYCDQVVKPFYRDHFARFDRQVVLVDSLGALNRGRTQVEEMGEALQGVLESFRYGPGSLLRRLFKPQIDKLLFAATKADHLTVDQHPNLLALTHDLMGQSRRQVRFAGGESETMVISAIRASEQGQVDDGRGRQGVIRGRDRDGEAVVRFPGEVPRQLPEPGFWDQQGFDFLALAPPPADRRPLPHIRLDHVLDWMLGDKTK